MIETRADTGVNLHLFFVNITIKFEAEPVAMFLLGCDRWVKGDILMFYVVLILSAH